MNIRAAIEAADEIRALSERFDRVCAELIAQLSRPDAEAIPGRDDLAEFDETPEVDGPINPISQSDEK